MTRHKEHDDVRVKWLGIPLPVWNMIIGSFVTLVLGSIQIWTKLEVSDHTTTLAKIQKDLKAGNDEIAKINSPENVGTPFPPITYQGGPPVIVPGESIDAKGEDEEILGDKPE